MKTTFVSTYALQSVVRNAVLRAQQEVSDSQLEMVTGRHADIGLALGSKTTRTVSLARDFARLGAMMENNAIVTHRLSTSQDVLAQMSDSATLMRDAIITVKGVEDAKQLDVAKREITGALQNFISLANASTGGEFLFSGINTDVQPMADYFAAGSAAKAAFDTAFNAMLAGRDPSEITADEMDDFLTNVVEPMFMGGDWEANWSDASDTNMSSRINSSEVIESSTNANAEGFRTFAMAAVVGVELLGLNLSSTTRAKLDERLVQMAGDAIATVDAERAQMGISESRVAKANDALQAQKDLVQTYIGELEGVDPYETKVRLDTLLTQLEASYSLTARIQQLSLMNYL